MFAYRKKGHIEVAATFVSEIVSAASGEKCVDEFTVIKGAGKPLFGKRIAEVFHIGLLYAQVYFYVPMRDNRAS